MHSTTKGAAFAPGNTHKHRFTDEAGNELASNALANGQGSAILDAADFDRLVADRHSTRWHLANNGSSTGYVRKSGRNRYIARILTGATSEQVVRYIDGDPRNLRRSNLRLQDRRQYLAERSRAAAERKRGGAL